MKLKFVLLLLWMCTLDIGIAQLRIIPLPNEITYGEGVFTVNRMTQVVDKSIGAQMGPTLKDILKNLPGGIANSIEIVEGNVNSTNIESYTIEVTQDLIRLTGRQAGLFYAYQSLMQMVSNSDNGRIPVCTIQDSPRFGYRGLMLDVSRHFFTVKQIKSLLDLMAYYKLNLFHWHLTDDQGWRIEIKSLPKLTDIGARRVKRLGHFGPNLLPPQPNEIAEDSNYYTQDQVRDIVRYAKERYIDILPEIDMPGHSMAAVAAYPHLCVTKDSSIQVNPGSSFSKWFPDGSYEMYIDNTLDPSKESTYDFVDKVITEIAELFPYSYIHIGGDECFKGFWRNSPEIKAFMLKNKLYDVHALQAYFISRVQGIVNSKKKKMIGWDEILQGNYKGNAAVMNRYAARTIDEQLQGGHNVVLTTSSMGLYFDYAQSKSDQEPINHGGDYSYRKTYESNPLSITSNPTYSKLLLGVQGCIWTEHIMNESKLYYMILPRLLSLSELSWTAQDKRVFDDFNTIRVPSHLSYFDKKGYVYWVPPVFEDTNLTLQGESFDYELESIVPNSNIYFTLNGKLPTEADFKYEKGQPIQIQIPKGKTVVLKTIVVTPAGRRSIVSERTMVNR